MGVAKAMTSASCIAAVISGASSAMTQRPVLRQAKQPRQKAISLPRRLIFRTSCPAERAPSAKASARASELLFSRKLAEMMRMFLPINALLSVLLI